MVAKTLGSYHIVAEVVRGGQATLYKATHIVLVRETALKVLHPHLIADTDFVQKFRAESKILARLKHPNIVAVYDAGVDQGLYWIAMEWLDGQAVDDLIARQGKLPVNLAVRIADQVAAALEYAHAQGLIHRDIKPGNMMLLPDGTVKVLDFGIAALVAAGQKAKTRVGTVEYMPLEQFNGQADARSDLYALGASLYHMLTGELPPPLAVHPPTPPRQLNPAVPAGLEAFLYQTLARDPSGRPQTATEFRQEMQAALTAPSITCPQCLTENRLGARYCQACGISLALTGPTGGTRRRRWRRWLTLALSILALSIAAVVAWFLLPPRYDSATGDIFWSDDRLLWARDSLLVSVPASASGPAHLVVKGRGGAIQTVGQDGRGQLWVGLAGDGLDYQQGDEWTRYVFEGGTEANTVQAIVSDRHEGVWVGTRDGAVRFDGEGWSFYTSTDGLSGNDIRAITVARDDTVWLGTWGDGLTSWREDRVVTYRFGDNEKWNRITALQDLEDDLWVGTQAGLIQLRPRASEVYYTQADGLAGDFVTALATDPDGRLWIGTWGGGVSTFDQSRIASAVFKPKKSNYVVDLAVGGNKVWVMSPDGIMVFDLETEVWTPY
ncbi:MAG: protein kinase [Anaerolineae bacterium]